MTKNKKIMCFTHWDLDGVVSYLVLRWTFPNATVECQPTRVQDFRGVFTKWLSANNLEDYDKVFILDLGIYNDKDLIDHENVFIVDHHPGHDNTTYTKAKSIIKEYGSACKLAYKAFGKLYNIKLTDAQKKLIALADDFDSYRLTVPESAQLDIVFWDSDDKFDSFTKSFLGGFHGFNVQQQNLINLRALKLQKIKDELAVYAGVVKIQGKERYVCSAFASQCINNVADILLKDYNAEVALVVNTKTDHISYRRKHDSDVDLSELATKLANGAGHAYSSGSTISEKFLLFTKALKKV